MTDRLPNGAVRRQAAEHSIPLAGAEAFHRQRRSAKRRGIPFLFTLPEWWSWWQIDGRWERRGRDATNLIMARHGDTGPYSAQNVYCTTQGAIGIDLALGVRVAGSKRGAALAMATGRLVAPWKGVRGDGHPGAKAVVTPAGRFGSAALAAEAHGINPNIASKLARTGRKGWGYETSKAP